MDVNILLFDNFETLDVFGPVEILGSVKEYDLHYYSQNGGEIVSAQNATILTKNITSASRDGILVVPGGKGTRVLINDLSFINLLKEYAEQARYCLSICTGSALLAKTGLLDCKKATSNKKAFEWVRSINSHVNWIRRARWVADGKFYTSSGVSAGMDMTLGFIKDRFNRQYAEEIATHIEYIWNSDCTADLFGQLGNY
ncbi:DJ-1/PfpI family protein [Mobilisporobacter senegalensis]|uniref:DJ-1/PfpI family protein n=1 Tax=Mobilisporobacter senegalensis TaxID=1329262 RepID=A0A3N1XHW3_9FIRM|nr:DJ-1/PfpI family protein [Mobilisporobacter senegalensis]ROR26299.1 DJ-1/PfpI family protein [Mobilisporobacter senegalensis]